MSNNDPIMTMNEASPDKDKSLVQRFKDAGTYAVKQAEYKKLSTIDLPAALSVYGRKIVGDPSVSNTYPDLLNQINELNNRINAIKINAQKELSSNSSLLEKSKLLALKAKYLGEIKLLEIQLGKLFAKLGESVFESNSDQSNSPEKIAVQNIKQQLSSLNEVIAKHDGSGNEKKWSSKKLLIVSGVALFLVVGIVGSKLDKSSKADKNGNASNETHDGETKYYKVKNGLFSSFQIEVTPLVAQEIELSDFDWDIATLTFTVHYKERLGGFRKGKGWYADIFDKNGVKLYSGILDIPGDGITVGEKFKSNILVTSDVRKKIAKIVIR